MNAKNYQTHQLHCNGRVEWHKGRCATVLRIAAGVVLIVFGLWGLLGSGCSVAADVATRSFSGEIIEACNERSVTTCTEEQLSHVLVVIGRELMLGD